jgi:hypothetical protein
VNKRTFSIAITAWSAKVLRSAICCSVNGVASPRETRMAPMGRPSLIIGTTRARRCAKAFARAMSAADAA